MKALVTGGAGFIGHHLVRRLLARGDDVSVIDDFSAGHRWRLEPFIDRIVLTEASVLDQEALDHAVVGCDVIFHEAAIASVAQSLVRPRLTNDVNVNGTIEVMLAAARHGVPRVILAGSSAVYGMAQELPCRESQRPEPQSPYGASKLAAEHYLHTIGLIHGIQTVSLRYFNVFGPGQDPASEYAAVVPRFIRAVLEGDRPVVNGSGEITRDFVYVDDVVDANLLAAQPLRTTALTCNIASGTRHSLLDLLGTIGELAGVDLDPVFGPPRIGDILHSEADITSARVALGYEPSLSFEDGVAMTLAWFRARSGAPDGDPAALPSTGPAQR